MTDSEWASWSENYRRVFSLVSDQDFLIVESWRQIFQDNGFTLPELQAATTWIAGHCPPRYRTEHLPAIKDSIHKQRAERAGQEQTPFEYRCPHEFCDGSGWVIVPHWTCVNNGKWHYPYYTLAVYCRCSRGEKIRQSHSSNSRLTRAPGINEYEKLNPDWFQQKQQRLRQVFREHDAQRLAASVERNGQPTEYDLALARVRKDFGLREVGEEDFGG